LVGGVDPAACSASDIPLAGRWYDNFNSAHVVNNTMWLSVSSWGASMYRITQFTSTYVIAQNPADASYNPSMWSKFEYHSTGSSIAYCTTVYNAPNESAALAADTTSIYDSSNATAGCNGFGFTIMSSHSIPVAGTWLSSFGGTHTITDNTWHSSASWGSSTHTILFYTPTYAIMQNPAGDSYNPSLWTKVEYHGLSAAGFSFCNSVYNGASWSAARSTATLGSVYNSSNAAEGCNGFPHTAVTAVVAA